MRVGLLPPVRMRRRAIVYSLRDSPDVAAGRKAGTARLQGEPGSGDTTGSSPTA